MLDETKFIECDCGHAEHTLRFVIDKSDDYPCIYTEILLNSNLGFFKRVYVAIQYIFGKTSDYGHFDTWMTTDIEKTKQIRDTFDEFLNILQPKG